MIVVDASVAFKWFNPINEKYRAKSLLILKNHKEKKEQITVPSLFFMEIANALITKTSADVKTIKENLDLLLEAEIQIYSFKKEDFIEATLEARKFKTTFYDMLYAVIAKNLKTVLVTADEVFIKKTKFPFVKPLSEYRGSNEI